MTEKHPKYPSDTNERAKAILDLPTMDEVELEALRRKQNPLSPNALRAQASVVLVPGGEQPPFYCSGDKGMGSNEWLTWGDLNQPCSLA